jgi:hypothetical protein
MPQFVFPVSRVPISARAILTIFGGRDGIGDKEKIAAGRQEGKGILKNLLGLRLEALGWFVAIAVLEEFRPTLCLNALPVGANDFAFHDALDALGNDFIFHRLLNFTGGWWLAVVATDVKIRDLALETVVYTISKVIRVLVPLSRKLFESYE